MPLARFGWARAEGRRTALVRAAIAAAVLGLAAAAVLLALGRREVQRSFIPPRASGIVLLDVSSSIDPTTFRQIEQTLAKLASTRDRFGLIFYSDVAYQALPPGTRALELKPLLRYFTPLKDAKPVPGYPSYTVADRPFPANPWTDAFTGGTQISSGLLLAREVIRAQHVVRPYVVLISDLADDYRDIPVLESLLGGYVRDRIPLRVVALSPSPGDLAVFQHALGHGLGRIDQAPEPPVTQVPRVEALASGVPLALMVVAGLLLVALALHETWSARLPLPALEPGPR